MISLCPKHNYPLLETVNGEMLCDKCITEKSAKYEKLSSKIREEAYKINENNRKPNESDWKLNN